MKKKLVSVLLSTAMVVSVLGGCGSTSSETAATTENKTEAATETKAEATAETKAEETQAGTEAEGEALAYKGDLEIMHYSVVIYSFATDLPSIK